MCVFRRHKKLQFYYFFYFHQRKVIHLKCAGNHTVMEITFRKMTEIKEFMHLHQTCVPKGQIKNQICATNIFTNVKVRRKCPFLKHVLGFIVNDSLVNICLCNPSNYLHLQSTFHNPIHSQSNQVLTYIVLSLNVWLLSELSIK